MTILRELYFNKIKFDSGWNVPHAKKYFQLTFLRIYVKTMMMAMSYIQWLDCKKNWLEDGWVVCTYSRTHFWHLCCCCCFKRRHRLRNAHSSIHPKKTLCFICSSRLGSAVDVVMVVCMYVCVSDLGPFTNEWGSFNSRSFNLWGSNVGHSEW